MDSVSADEARRIALAAQGFADPRPKGAVTRRHLRKVLDRVGAIQIDSVNVLCRSQELPLLARLGSHPRDLIPRATKAGEVFEYWSHAASHLPVEAHPLYRWQMEKAAAGVQFRSLATVQRDRPGLVEEVERRIREDGPIVAGDVSTRTGPKGTWWDWDDGKRALEYLFASGRLTARRRESDFARVYDLPERTLPAWVLDLPAPDEHEGRKALLLLAARSLGVATYGDLSDYYRLSNTRSRDAMQELVSDGALLPVEVEGWRERAYLLPGARLPRRIRARALLSPFDSLIWSRKRTERIFEFDYVLEIYLPPPKRVYGYYVLAFLLGDELVARVDLKADRVRGVLMAKGVFGELGVPADEIAGPLAAELALMASWLGLDGGVEVGDRGDLADPLSAELQAMGSSGSLDEIEEVVDDEVVSEAAPSAAG
jgi:uncharacterized protein YcaQ